VTTIDLYVVKGYYSYNILKIKSISYQEKSRDWPDDASATSLGGQVLIPEGQP